jgi:hypothetical protein
MTVKKVEITQRTTETAPPGLAHRGPRGNNIIFIFMKYICKPMEERSKSFNTNFIFKNLLFSVVLCDAVCK